MERDYSNRSCNTCCFDTNGKCDINKKTGCVSNTNDWNDKDYWASKLDDESDALIYKEKQSKKYEDKLVAKDVEIKFGEHDIKVDLYVNKEGNISIQFKNGEEQMLAPDGTCIEGYNTDVIFYPYFGENLEAKQDNESEAVFEGLYLNYQKSDVCSGEFYHQEKISMVIPEVSVRKGIQRFLDWDESKAKFELQKGKTYWKIIDK